MVPRLDIALPSDDLTLTPDLQSADLVVVRDLAQPSDLTMLPGCANGVRDGNETDVDCGGGTCGKCGIGKSCLQAPDCASGFCESFVCKTPPTCNDMIKNANETDVDCGGGTCPRCPDGKNCVLASDCVSSNCINGLCMTQTCNNGLRDGAETDVDCGGGMCPKCAYAKTCSVNADCIGGTCTNKSCAATCTDGVKNQSETDVDCGGTCSKCQIGKKCASNADCASAWCNNGVCTANTCMPKFNGGVTFDVTNSTGMRNGDFNGDGKVDLVIQTANALTVIPGNGDGTFKAPVVTMINLPGTISTIFADADWNGDGFDDLAIGVKTDVLTVFNKGDATFKAGPTITNPDPSNVLQLGDFNFDHKTDLLGWSTTNNGVIQSHLDEMLGNGDGTFVLKLVATGAVGCPYVDVGVASSHRKMADRYVYSQSCQGNQTLIGPVGSINFASYGCMIGSGLVIGDFDGDRLDDVVAQNGSCIDQNAIAFNWSVVGGNGSFHKYYTDLGVKSKVNIPAVGQPIGDWSGDGKTDAFNQYQQLVCGNGDTSFAPPVPWTWPAIFLAADYNGDGKTDYFSFANNTITLNLNAN